MPHAFGERGVTIGIPVRNEEDVLLPNAYRLMKYLDGLGVDYQLIIGSNGSTDRTVELGERLQREHACVEFFHIPSTGVGLAFREFVDRAKFSMLISLDMDLSTDMDFVERVLAFGPAHDIVVGSKKLATQRRSLFRRSGSNAFLWWVRLITKLPYDDYSIGAKVYSVAFVKSACPIDKGSSYVLDLCFAAKNRDRSIACIPVGCDDRRASKFSLFDEAIYKFGRLFFLWWHSCRATETLQWSTDEPKTARGAK